MVKNIIIIGIVAVIAFIGLLLYSILPRTKNAAKYQPFKTLIGTEIETVRETVLIQQEKPEQSFVEHRLLDTLSTYSEIIAHAKAKYVLPPATKLKVTGAKFYYNAVSGSTITYVLGEVKVPEIAAPITFEYIWGSKSYRYDTDKRKNIDFWQFPLAAWQSQPDPTVYDLPTHIY